MAAGANQRAIAAEDSYGNSPTEPSTLHRTRHGETADWKWRHKFEEAGRYSSNMGGQRLAGGMSSLERSENVARHDRSSPEDLVPDRVRQSI